MKWSPLHVQEKFEDTKRRNRNPLIEEEQTIQLSLAQKKMNKRANNDLQTLHIKLKIEQHEPHLNQMNPCAPDVLPVSATFPTDQPFIGRIRWCSVASRIFLPLFIICSY